MWNVVNFLRDLAAKGKGPTTAAARTTNDGVFSEDQARQGEAAFKDRCAACHGEDLTGAGFAPPLTSDAFLGHWVDKKVGELFVIVKATMPSNSPGSLTDAVYADLVAFLLKANGYPAGGQPLPTEPAGLDQIVIAKP
jgi:mono/diheme cytochrome c family protein